MATNSTRTKAAARSKVRVSSQAIAITISVLVAGLIAAYLWLSPQWAYRQQVLALALTFSACFLLVYFSYEALIFREVNSIYRGLGKYKRQEFKRMSNKFLLRPDPLKRIKEQIYQMAEHHHREIEELKELQVLRREFLADVSHELKTPIFAAQGFIHTLLDGAMDDERVRVKFLTKAATSLDGLDMLVQDLITISQLEKGVMRISKTVFDLHELAPLVFDQLEAKARQKQISLRLSNEKNESFIVEADRGRVTQVLINLIDNAVKYGQQGGHIWLSFQEGKKKITVTVRDDGPGIENEHLTRIFERFYRIDKSRTRDALGGGSGLGLAITKHIVEAHKSAILVKSELGKGTSFQFKLSKPKD